MVISLSASSSLTVVRGHRVLAGSLAPVQAHRKVQPVVLVLGQGQRLLGGLELVGEIRNLSPELLGLLLHVLPVGCQILQLLNSLGRQLGSSSS